MSERDSCATCIYFVPLDERIGHCRRYPPTMFVTTQAGAIIGQAQPAPASFWPPVMPAHWCGEHRDDGMNSIDARRPEVTAQEYIRRNSKGDPDN